MALNLIQRASDKDSFRLRREVVAWDHEFPAKLHRRMIFFYLIPLRCDLSHIVQASAEDKYTLEFSMEQDSQLQECHKWIR